MSWTNFKTNFLLAIWTIFFQQRNCCQKVAVCLCIKNKQEKILPFQPLLYFAIFSNIAHSRDRIKIRKRCLFITMPLGVNFINIIRTKISYERHFSSYVLHYVSNNHSAFFRRKLEKGKTLTSQQPNRMALYCYQIIALKKYYLIQLKYKAGDYCMVSIEKFIFYNGGKRRRWRRAFVFEYIHFKWYNRLSRQFMRRQFKR